MRIDLSSEGVVLTHWPRNLLRTTFRGISASIVDASRHKTRSKLLRRAQADLHLTRRYHHRTRDDTLGTRLG